MAMVVIGARVRSYRKRLGLSQTELGNRARLSQDYISSIENNHRPKVSADALDRIAATLGITVDHLLDDTPPPVVVSDAGPDYEVGTYQINDDGEVVRLIALYRRLNQKDRKRILDLAHRLAMKVEPRIVGEEEE